MDIHTPKVFISYSWAVQDSVIEFAERLRSHGIDIVLDIWDLKEGHDKYAFMEQSVTSPEIDRVLIICDKTYTQKANNREGGAGDETVIISQEVYGHEKQEKFIPVILEVDPDSKPYVPAYIKSRIYIDLSDDSRYEEEYEKLLRNIYDKPLYKKPPLGKMPEWLENEKVDMSRLRDLIKQIKGYTGGNKTKADFLIRTAIDACIENLNEFGDFQMSGDDLLRKIDEMKPLRDLYLDLLEVIIYSDLPITETVTTFFEKVYNETFQLKPGISAYSETVFEFLNFFIWESFICTVAVLLHYEKFKELHDILYHTYFLRNSCSENYELQPENYSSFRKYMKTIEEICKPKCENPRYYTLTGHIMIKREKKPIITAQTISNADIVLYQLFKVYDIDPKGWCYWFPTTYIYHKGSQPQWVRLKSKAYCEKLYPLFGVSSINGLKTIISKSTSDGEMRHSGCFECAPVILSEIKLDDIGSMN